MSSLVDWCLNKRLVFQWVRIVLYFSSICFYLHAYEVAVLQWLLRNKERILAHILNSGFRYIDDVLSLNNNYIESIQMIVKLRILLILKSLLRTFTLKSTTKKIKNQTLRQTWWFHFSNSHIPLHHLCIELTFHSSYVILECVLSTFIFWTELYCLHKSYSNKATLLLGWSNRYKQSTVVITIWLTVTKYSYHNFKWQLILYYLRTFCFPLSLPRLLTDVTISA